MQLYNGWKMGKFIDLVTDEMDLVAQKMLKRIVKVSREIKVREVLLLVPFVSLSSVSHVYILTRMNCTCTIV